MRLLLTGASSFVGRHLAAYLGRAGFEIFGTYRTARPAMDRLCREGARSDLRLVPLDLADQRAYASLPDRIDAVIHVAGVSTAEGVSVDEMLACNVAGTRNVIRYALTTGAERFVYASTLSVHGDIDDLVVDDATPVVRPDVYGASKFLGERLLADVAHRLPSVSVRLPGVLGRGARRAWIPTLLSRALRGDAITIFNPDSPFNNVVHIDDLDRFFVELMSRHWHGAHAFPLGADGQITIREVAERIVRAAGSRSRVDVHPAMRPSFVVSSDLARTFGYDPGNVSTLLDRYLEDETASH